MEQPEKQPSRHHEWKKWAIIPGSLFAVIAAEEALRHHHNKHKKTEDSGERNDTEGPEGS